MSGGRTAGSGGRTAGSGGRPALPEVGLVAMVQHDWSDLWQPRHHILSRLARYFTVVWVAPGMPILRQGARSSRRAAIDRPVEELPGFGVVSSASAPPHVRRPAWAGRVLRARRAEAGRRELERAGCSRIIAMIWRPELGSVLDSLTHDVSSYYLDDDYAFADEETPIDPEERALIERVDRVFVHSSGLEEKKGRINRRTTLVPNGVDYEAFSTTLPPPEELARIRRPRLGYAGRLKVQLDWPLIAALAERRADWSFVLVGPFVDIDPETDPIVGPLLARDNVHWLGPRSVSDLPAFQQHFDVSLLPYRRTAYTDCIYPMKLHEALAAGLPVVGSPIRTLREFRSVIEIAEGPDRWVASIERGLSPEGSAPDRVAARRAVAAAHDWDLVADRVARTLAGDLGPPWAERLAAAFPPPDEGPSA